MFTPGQKLTLKVCGVVAAICLIILAIDKWIVQKQPIDPPEMPDIVLPTLDLTGHIHAASQEMQAERQKSREVWDKKNEERKAAFEASMKSAREKMSGLKTTSTNDTHE